MVCAGQAENEERLNISEQASSVKSGRTPASPRIHPPGSDDGSVRLRTTNPSTYQYQRRKTGSPTSVSPTPWVGVPVVREIPLDVFDRILRAARSRPPAPPTPQSNTLRATLIVEDDPTRLFLRRPRSGRLRTTSAGTRKSDRSREVGDWAEERVLEHLRKTLSSGGRDSLRWVAQEGETPGWDISYEDDDGQLIAVEVKGTTLSRFSSLEMTSNEWSAAERMGSRYVLALVVRAASSKASLALMQNPFSAKERGLLAVEPLSWRLRMMDSDET